MTTYSVTHKSLGRFTIEADHFTQDGSGVRFYDEAAAILAFLSDGEVVSVLPASVTFEEDEPEED